MRITRQLFSLKEMDRIRITTRKIKAAANIVLTQLAVTCKIESECPYQTFMQVDSEVLRNCQLWQHANRFKN
jgi:hypothetical protein